MNVLEVQAVSKFYGDFTALSQVDISVKQGSIFGLLGPNGAGKTSLIRIINQITAPDEGSITFKGEPLQPEHIAQIGYLPEERGLYPKMKVREQLVYLARLKGLNKQDAQQRVQKWLNHLDIESWQNKNLEELSKGMAQKIQFIATVIHQPQLLIFDEPFTGFDPVNTELIKSEILRLRDEGASIIFSTHRMESVEEICDEIALINKGNKILEGSISQVKSDFSALEYVVNLQGEMPQINLEHAAVLHHEIQNGKTQLHLRSKGDNTTPLLNELMAKGQVLSFAERVPSLNEIFIAKVQGE